MSLNMPNPTFGRLLERVEQMRLFEICGRVTQVVGLVVEANGPNARIGDVCLIEPENGDRIRAEVVGFRGDRVLLMPLGEMAGVRSGCLVRGTGGCLRVDAGPGLLGRVLNGLGEPIDGNGPLKQVVPCPVSSSPPEALRRTLIEEPFQTGVRAIDGLLTIGVGQRVGILAGSGVGKSTLLGMIARGGGADVNVVALIGERGREVREFIETDLGAAGMERTVVVCATSDAPALVRIKAAQAATAIAEHFRDKGLSVMLMMDSVTRYAMALREVGLAVGEPPSAKGYTPSVFAALPRLLERAGCGATGAITALYTVLVEGDDTNEPIADATRSILDGHIVLSRRLTERGHYPPIDILQSLSRVMPSVADDRQLAHAQALRELLSAYADVEDLVSIGAYKPGAKPLADRAIERWERIVGFLRQAKGDATPALQTLSLLEELVDA